MNINIRNVLKIIPSELKKKFLFITLGYVTVGLLEIFGITLVFPIIALIVEPQTIMEISSIKEYFPNINLNEIVSFVPFLAVLMIIFLVSKNIVSILINRWQIKFLNNGAASLSIDLFKKYAHMPYLDSLNRDSSYLQYMIYSSSSIIYNSFITPILQIFSEIITILMLLLIMVSVDAISAILIILFNFIAGALLFLVTKNKLKIIGYENRILSEKIVRILRECFNNFKEFKVLSRENFFEKKFVLLRDKMNKNQTDQMIYVMFNRNLMEVMLILIISFMAVFLFLNKPKGQALAQLSLYGLVSIRFIPAISRIFSSLQLMKTAEGTIELMASEYDFLKNLSSDPLIKEANLKALIPLQKPLVQFKDLFFSYNIPENFCLNKLSFEIKPNTAVGIVGRSGSGKTTIADIILGLLKPSQGQVLINHENIEDVLIEWKKVLGYVPQKISFVESTITENIAFGIPIEDIDIERINEVIKMVQLVDDLQQFENGLDTLIKEDGSNLSGGQRQRIGLARALYHKPSFLILDEATSSLDVETEHKISKSINLIKSECTILIIAHRLTTIQECDNIFYVDKGTLVGEGTFEELSTSNKAFKKLVKLSMLADGSID